MLEVPVEGLLSAESWITRSGTSTNTGTKPGLLVTKGSGPGVGLVASVVEAAGLGSRGEDGGKVVGGNVDSEGGVGEGGGGGEGWGETLQWEVWAVMLQALRGLAAVHAVSEGTTHRAVCLANILVAERRIDPINDRDGDVGGGGSGGVAGAFDITEAAQTTTGLIPSLSLSQPLPASSTSASMPTLPRGFRRAQLGPPAPAALARPPPESLAPEVVRGKPFGQPADVYAFGVALRTACCWGDGTEDGAGCGGDVGSANVGGGPGRGGGGGGVGVNVGSGTWGRQGMLAPGVGPPPGPLRQALIEVLGIMLEEDPSQRCTVVEVSDSSVYGEGWMKGIRGYGLRLVVYRTAVMYHPLFLSCSSSIF